MFEPIQSGIVYGFAGQVDGIGSRMCDVAARCGAEVVAVEVPWGRPVEPEALLAAHPAPTIIAVVHASHAH